MPRFIQLTTQSGPGGTPAIIHVAADSIETLTRRPGHTRITTTSGAMLDVTEMPQAILALLIEARS